MAASKVAYANLRAEMARKNVTIKNVAEILGVRSDAAGRKLSGKTKINLDEAIEIQEKLFPEASLKYLFEELYEKKSA